MSIQLIQKLRALVNDGGMSRSGLARAAGLHANTLRDLDAPDWNPTAETLRKLETFLFSNDDTLAAQLFDAGQSTGEKVWRMPLGAEYDKLIDTKNADMKNIGTRFGGAIIAAQFLKRFVGDTAWAHLDIAGTAMGTPASEYNQSWASGFGVRLLDRLVQDNFEG